MSYDIIGDIHGCDQTLVAMLETLGYRMEGGTFEHATRRVVFLGDFIDRGPGHGHGHRRPSGGSDGSRKQLMANGECESFLH